MMLVTLDIESFYSKTYSLSKMTTEEYINGDEFEVIGISIKLGDTPTAWYTGSRLELLEILQRFDWKNIVLCGHNCFFDGSILSFYFGIVPAKYVDTLSMARAVHGISVGGSLAKLAQHYELGVKGTEVIDALGKHLGDFTEHELDAYGAYCINDTELTYKLFQCLLPHFNITELSLIDLTIRMGTVPLLEVDPQHMKQHLLDVIAAKQALMDRVIVDKSEIISNPKFAKLLEDCGVQVPMKVSKITGKQTYAFAKTDDGLKALLEHPNLMVQTLVAARLGTKSTIEETRTQRYIGIAERMNGKLPIPLSYYGAGTGRWTAGGGQATNFQNIPRKSRIKGGIRAPEGYAIVGADLSNIELRVGLWLAGELGALKLLGDGGDLYREFASMVFDIDYDDVDADQRFIGKTSCIAEGQLVLTPRGLIPIENILLDDNVWDGVEWVRHDGVVYMGERDVITYQGLTATPDHIVFMEDGSTSEFGIAANKKETITTTGNSRESGVSRAGKVKVYDILNAGPRHRYTVSNLLAHNCLSLIFGVGSARLQTAIKEGSGTDLGGLEAKRIVDLYRETYVGVVDMWRVCGDAIRVLAGGGKYSFGPDGFFTIDGKKGIMLPSGLYMQYPDLEYVIDKKTGEKGYQYKIRNGRDRLYGGKVFNNLTQATARCIMSEAVVRISKRYPVVLTVHDSIYCVVPEQEAAIGYEFMHGELTRPPEWMPSIPLGAEGGWGKTLKDAG